MRLWLALGWSLVCLVAVLSLVPNPIETPTFKAQDKVLHLAAYGGLMLWFGAIYRTGGPRRRIGVLLLLMGAALELAQGATGYRSPQSLDVLANGAGVLLGWLLARTRLGRTLLLIESRL
ncbi:MAG: VanZ family protein [Deltaproteobacteria bacterium]|nr:VanZ family protein [Deltaproteobacteria bacterium]